MVCYTESVLIDCFFINNIYRSLVHNIGLYCLQESVVLFCFVVSFFCLFFLFFVVVFFFVLFFVVVFFGLGSGCFKDGRR